MESGKTLDLTDPIAIERFPRFPPAGWSLSCIPLKEGAEGSAASVTAELSLT
jgi:hypothetical protein